MTIICIRDGKISTDSGSVREGIVIETNVQKIRSLDTSRYPKSYSAFAGDVTWGEEFHRWVSNDTVGPPPKLTETHGSFIILTGTSNGFSNISVFNTPMLTELKMHVPFYSEGYHREFAFGAMAAGVSAEEAANLVLKHTTMVSGKVTTRDIYNWKR